jgi:pSer/pThr/pTyr-binding forkhead associated (FHA) protein
VPGSAGDARGAAGDATRVALFALPRFGRWPQCRAMIRVRVTVKGQVQEERDVDGELTIGRKPPADVVVADGEVSSRHAKLRADRGGLHVTDLGSTNGSTIDGGERLAPNVEVALPPGKKLKVGPAVIEVLESRQEPGDGFSATEKTVAIGGGAMQSMLVNLARFKAAQPQLVVAAEHDRRVVPIDEMEVVVGRDPKSAKIAIPHQSVSGQHAKIRFENGRFLVEDLKSSNGTFVDGNPVAVATPIQGEQALTFGTVDCLFVAKGAESGSAQQDTHAEALCDHAVRLGKATQQQAKDVLAEHRKAGTSLGRLFVERGIMGPKEWSEIWRQRQIIGTLAPLAGKKDGDLSKVVALVVIVLGLAALAFYFFAK